MAGPTTLFQTGIHSARPAASAGCVLYSCTTHGLVYRSDGSAWTTFLTLSSGGSVASDAIFDAKGDLPVGTGADTAAKLAAGANGLVLTADSTQTTGLKYAVPTIPFIEALASADTTTATDTIIDVVGCTGSFAAGTWSFEGTCAVDTGSAVYTLLELCDGSNTAYAIDRGIRSTGTPTGLHTPPRILVLGTTTTIKLRLQTGAAATGLRFGTGSIPGTSLVGIRLL